jgi:predicted acyltransferase
VDSVDALRGLVILAMIFVNDIAGVRAAPWWLKHYPGEQSGMTVVDWVFGGFLFVVGMSIPLAIESRRARGESALRILGHVILRTLSLLVLGILMVNMPANPGAMGWPKHLWEVLVYACAIAAWNAPARDAPPWCHRTATLARMGGFVALALLAVLYRGRDGSWLTTQWWGILGLIGWAYLTASLLYLWLGNDRGLLVAAAGALMCLYFAQSRQVFSNLWISKYLDLGVQIGSHGAIALCGAALGALLLPSSNVTDHLNRMSWAGLFGTTLLLAGALLVPVYGISKNLATPSWSFGCAAITCWLWVIIYLIVDVARVRPVAWFLSLAGANALLIYLLQPLFYHLIWMFGFELHGRLGSGSLASGISRSAGLATALTLLAGALNLARVRMRL